MAYTLQQGIQVSLDGTTWYPLTDHNRGTIDQSFEIIEKTARMANGIMRKYVIDKKSVIAVSWDFVPSKTALTVDGGRSSEWLSAFYDTYVTVPIWVKLVNAYDPTPSAGSYPDDNSRVTSRTGAVTLNMFITKFSSNVLKRTADTDWVNMSIEFTEV
jgi:hypothetical protein